MSRVKKFIVAFSIAATLFASLPSDANADGPLRRWWRSLQARRTGVAAYNPAAVAPNAYNLQPGQCMTTCQKTCSRTVVNYVPVTAYRTCQKQIPVTSYKPVTSTDPCTGCTVTCMKPCTTYSVQTQRVPYTTYRPVYRTETYKVPVTTITNNCATGTCATGTCATGTCGTYPTAAAGCATCATGGTPVYQTQPFYGQPGVPTPAPVTNTRIEYPAGVPTGGLGTPADQTPALGGINPVSSQRSVVERLNSTNSYKASAPTYTPAPTTIRIEDKTARSPVRTRWSYSPVRLASYTAPTATPSFSRDDVTPATRTQLAPIQRTPAPIQRTSGWVEIK